jgi:acetyl esterase/lipase
MLRRALVWLAAGAVLGTPAARAQETPPRPITVWEDIVFAKVGERELRLDLARPKDGDEPLPAIVCLHGGGWVGGDRKQLSQTLAALARRGYVAVSPDYRLAPADRFPAQIEDCKAAVRWLRANARTFHIDPDHIGALGFSAGGHLACLLGLTVPADGLEGNGGNAEQSSAVQAVASFFGPTDLMAKEWGPVAEKQNIEPLLGGSREEKPEAYRKASPVTYADRKGPPVLLFHGDADPVVPLVQSQRLAEKLRAANSPVLLVTIEGAGHGWRGAPLQKSLEQALDFLDGQLKK